MFSAMKEDIAMPIAVCPAFNLILNTLRLKTVFIFSSYQQAQREYERVRKREQRCKETPEQREARLKKMREYMAAREAKENGTAPGGDKTSKKESKY